MKFCPECGEENPDESKFCRRCGINFIREEPKTSQTTAKKVKVETNNGPVRKTTVNTNSSAKTKKDDDNTWCWACCICMFFLFIIFAIAGF